MKRTLLIILALLIAAPVYASPNTKRHLEPETVVYQSLSSATQSQFNTNETIKLIKYGAGITLSSITLNRSDVAGTAFITNPSVDLREYVGFKITLNDTGTGAVGWIQAAGTGETYLNICNGSLLNGNMETGNPPTGWAARNTETLTRASDERTGGSGGDSYSLDVNGGTGNSGVTQSFTLTTNALYFMSGWGKSVGNNYGGNIGLYGASSLASLTFTSQNAWTFLSGYQIPSLGQIILKNNSTYHNEMRFDDIYVGKVLTPSATGVTIWNLTAQNWVTIGSTPNAASFNATLTAQ